MLASMRDSNSDQRSGGATGVRFSTWNQSSTSMVSACVVMP
jgi:hypothetical protein